MKYGQFIQLIRPKTLLLSLSLSIYGGLLVPWGLQEQSSFHTQELLGFLLIAILALSLQSAANVYNDLKDFQNGTDRAEKRLGEKRLSYILGESKVKKAFWFCLLLAFLAAIGITVLGTRHPHFLENLLFFLSLLTLGVLFVFIYSGGPFPICKTPLGELFSAFVFGPFAVVSAVFIQTFTGGAQTEPRLFYYVFTLGITPGLLCANVLLINNIRDQYTDEKASRFTLPILLRKIGLGERFSVWVYLTNWLLGIGVSAFSIWNAHFETWKFFFAFWVLLSIWMLLVLRELAKRPLSMLNPLLAQSSLIAFVYLLGFGLIFIH